MKRIVATRLALIIGTTMIVISLLNFLIQRDDVIKNFKDEITIIVVPIIRAKRVATILFI